MTPREVMVRGALLARRQHIAVVVGEFGETRGLVTLEIDREALEPRRRKITRPASAKGARKQTLAGKSCGR